MLHLCLSDWLRNVEKTVRSSGACVEMKGRVAHSASIQ